MSFVQECDLRLLTPVSCQTGHLCHWMDIEPHLSSLWLRGLRPTLALFCFLLLIQNSSWYSLTLVYSSATMAVAFILVSHYLPNKYLHRVGLGAQGCVLNGPKVGEFCGSTTEAQRWGNMVEIWPKSLLLAFRVACVPGTKAPEGRTNVPGHRAQGSEFPKERWRPGEIWEMQSTWEAIINTRDHQSKPGGKVHGTGAISVTPPYIHMVSFISYPLLCNKYLQTKWPWTYICHFCSVA